MKPDTDWRISFTYRRGPGWWGDTHMVQGASLREATDAYQAHADTLFGPGNHAAFAAKVIPTDPEQCEDCHPYGDGQTVLCPWHHRQGVGPHGCF